MPSIATCRAQPNLYLPCLLMIVALSVADFVVQIVPFLAFVRVQIVPFVVQIVPFLSFVRVQIVPFSTSFFVSYSRCALQNPKTNHRHHGRHQLSYAIATRINNTLQLTPFGALPIAIVGRITPATASKTARSSLLLSEFTGYFYSTLTTLQLRPADDDDLLSPQPMQLIYRRSGHH